MKKLIALIFIGALVLMAPVAQASAEKMPDMRVSDTKTAGNLAYETHLFRLASLPVSDAFSFRQGNEIVLRVTASKHLLLTKPCNDAEWISSEKRVVSVSKGGMITAKHPGVAVITARNVHTGQLATCTVKVYRKHTQAQARRAILTLKNTYWPGRRWTNANHYFWQAAQCHCYGCAAFAALASDTAFGKYAPLKRHTSFSRIRIGDHVRIGNKHSTVVLRKKRDAIVVAEGNYSGVIHWGRVISYDSLIKDGFYVETRY